MVRRGGFGMNECEYLLFVKEVGMFNEVRVWIVESLLKKGRFMRG